MSITISLPPQTEEKLRQRAAENGQTVDNYLRQIVEREVLGASSKCPVRLPSDEPLAPFRKQVAESGMSDDELLEFFEGVREEVHQDKHGRSSQDP